MIIQLITQYIFEEETKTTGTSTSRTGSSNNYMKCDKMALTFVAHYCTQSAFAMFQLNNANLKTHQLTEDTINNKIPVASLMELMNIYY